MKIGQIIKKRREKKNLTISQIASHVNKSSRLVSYWENNKRDPSTKDFIKLIFLLNIKLSDLEKTIKENK